MALILSFSGSTGLWKDLVHEIQRYVECGIRLQSNIATPADCCKGVAGD